jgi:hypothetical protein
MAQGLANHAGVMAFQSHRARLTNALPEATREFALGAGFYTGGVYGYFAFVNSSAQVELRQSDPYGGSVVLVSYATSGLTLAVGDCLYFERFQNRVSAFKTTGTDYGKITGSVEAVLPLSGGYAKIFGGASFCLWTNSNSARLSDVVFSG